MKKDLVIGIDCSTTACKAIAWDSSGVAVGQGRFPIPLERPQPGWHEQPADAWWQAALHAINQLSGQIGLSRLAGLAIAVQRETFVPVDDKGRALRPGIVWMDERSRTILSDFSHRIGQERVHTISGKPLSGNLSLSKIEWIRQFEPDIFSRTAYYQDVHAYLVTQFTGNFKTSWGTADPMGLFDMRENTWSADLLQGVGVSPAQMPDAYPPGTYLGEVTAIAARLSGLPQGLPVFAGIGDGQAGALGAGLALAGETCINLGTAAVSATGSDQYMTDPAFRTTYAGLPGSFLLETVLLGGSYTVSWFIEQFAHPLTTSDARLTQSEDTWEAAAAVLPPGAQGLMLVPYWNSVMSPYWDAGASGMVVGWRGIHTPAHLYRAILEGIAYELLLQIEGVERILASGNSSYPAPKSFILFGGGSKSPLWRKILADITGKPILLSPVVEATALGAGILASCGVGWFPDLPSAITGMTRTPRLVIEPDPQNTNIYHQLYEEVYRGLFPAVQSALDRLTELTEE